MTTKVRRGAIIIFSHNKVAKNETRKYYIGQYLVESLQLRKSKIINSIIATELNYYLSW